MIKLIDMGNRMTKMNSSDRSLRVEDCVFCGIIRGEGTRKIYEDNDVIAFQAANQAAKIHILVCPKQHIVSHSHLRNTQEDKDLLETMLGVGRRLVQEQEGKELEPCQMKFGFHTPPFLSVPHLHLHCFVLPHSPHWMGYQYVQTKHGTLGFVTVDQVLQRLETQELGR